MTEPQPVGAEPEFAGVEVRERHGLVLLLILIGYLVPSVDDRPVLNLARFLLWMGLLLVALWSPGLPNRLRRSGLAVVFALMVISIGLVVSGTTTASGLVFMLMALAQLLALLAILSRVSSHDHVSAQTVMGAVAGYALIAFIMASLFHGLELLAEAPFLNGAESPGDYIYFSFVTLTTVGFGDITAASDLAKRLVVVEAFVGQIFLVTLVARLVTLWGQPLQRLSRR
jgi:voltage-gated potassium channel Kch